MANNPIIYNGAIQGLTGGIHERWITSVDSADYNAIRNLIVEFAGIIDGLIPADPTLGSASAALMQSICQGVMANRYPSSRSEFVAIAQAIVALWTTLDEQQETIETGVSALQYFDDAFLPIGRWNFNGVLTDAGGVTANDLILDAGSLAFADVVPGKQGLYVLAGARYETAAPVPALQLLGDMTLAVICQADANPFSEQVIARYQGAEAGDLQADNILYSLAFGLITNPVSAPRRITYIHEHNAGVNDPFTSTGTASLPPVHNVALMGFSRINNVVQPYSNGVPLGNPSATLIAPNGGNGANTRFTVGVNSTVDTCAIPFLLFSMQVINRGLSAAEWRAMYNQSMGPAFGSI